MKNFYCWIVCASFIFISTSFSSVAALEKAENPQTGSGIPNQSAQSGCVTYKINPKRLYAPLKLQVLSKNLIREFLFEDPSDEVFDKSTVDTGVLANSSVIVNYIDRNGRVVPGETESGRSSGNIGDCREKITLNFGLKATAGSFEFLNSKASKYTARDYYDAIDPGENKTTLNDWKRENGFFALNIPTQSEQTDAPDINLSQSSTARVKPKTAKLRIGTVEQQDNSDDAAAVYFNHGDLGFGRDMHMKRSGKNNKNIAFYVTNYRSLEDTIDRKDPIATVAMEYSYGSRKGKDKSRYIQFYAFGANGDRIEAADLDGRGEKYLPQLCMTCHGGLQGDREIASSDIPKAGGIGARFLPFDLNAFDFSESDSQYSRAAQEAVFKTMNEAILEAFPTDAMTQLITGWYTDRTLTGSPKTGLQPNVIISKSSRRAKAKVRPSTGIAAQSGSPQDIQAQTGSSTGLSRPTQDSTYVPVGWRGAHEELYTEIVAPYCRGCHITRRNDMDWTTYEEFAGYGSLIKLRVCENSSYTMPNAKATYQNMWLNSVDPIDVFTRHNIFEVASGESCGQGPWARP